MTIDEEISRLESEILDLEAQLNKLSQRKMDLEHTIFTRRYAIEGLQCRKQREKEE